MCQPCNGDLAMTAIPAVVIIAVATAIAVAVATSRCGSRFMTSLCVRTFMPGSKAKMIISLYQMLGGIGAAFSIPYPPFYIDLLHSITSIIEVNLPKALPLGCTEALRGFLPFFVLRTLLPLLLIVALAITSRLARRQRPEVAEMCSTGWYFVIFLVYPSCSAAVFRAFNCISLPDATQALRADYAITFWAG